MIQKMRNNDKGFTLIELMIVIAIIGILAAIAIPNFVSYRQRSYNSAAQSDLKNSMTSQEAYFVDNATYANSSTKVHDAGYVASNKVTLVVTGSDSGYTMTAYHSTGNTTWTVNGPGNNMGKASAS